MISLIRMLAIVWLVVGATFVPVMAQDAQAPDYTEWTNLATRAEGVIEAGRASESALEDLRAEVAGWRDAFLIAQDANAPRIDTLQAQLDALGPAPEDGVSEPEDIATRRADLTDQLVRLRTPVQRAEEAYTRADGIIGEIDLIIRERQTDALLELGPSPVNPALWGTALDDLQNSASESLKEVVSLAGSPARQAQARANLPLILLLLVAGVMLLTRGQQWARAAIDKLRGTEVRGRGVWQFLVSLGQVVLPLIGIYALSRAAVSTGMIGQRWTLLLDQLPLWAGLLLGIRWLAERSFNDNDDVATMPLDREDRHAARTYSNLLAVLYVLRDVLDTLTQFDRYSAETAAVLDFPVVALAGLFLFRLGSTRNAAPVAGTRAAMSDEGLFRMRFARILGRAAMIVGVVGPVMAAIGYGRVGEGLVFPFIASLALIGLVLVIQELINDLYELVTRRTAAEADSLLPVLAGFCVTLLALPPLALIWGARVADLTELWARFREGFQIGETRISPTDFLVVAIVFVAGYMLTRLLQGAMRSSVLPKTKIDQGGQNAIVAGLGYVGIFLSAIVAITAGGLDLSSLAIVAGALSVGIGFGLQNIVSNFVSGIILLIERPISEGDWIEVGGRHGIVKDISVRSTRIETFDRFDVIVPNADLVSGQVTNYTRGNVIGRVIVPVGVAYGNDTRKVEKVLLHIARDHPMVLMNPAPSVNFVGFGADSMDFEIRAILHDVNQTLSVKTEMNHQIAERFAEEGIEIPFAQRDIWIRNPEALASPLPGVVSAVTPPEQPVTPNTGLDVPPDTDGDSK